MALNAASCWATLFLFVFGLGYTLAFGAQFFIQSAYLSVFALLFSAAEVATGAIAGYATCVIITEFLSKLCFRQPER